MTGALAGEIAQLGGAVGIVTSNPPAPERVQPPLHRGGAKRPPAIPCEGVKQQLLIVEDDEVTRSFLAENLEADGFAVACASGAAEGVRAIEVRHPALVLLDLRLEQGHGLELLDRVRCADGIGSRIDPELPILVISGRASEADRVRGFARGADDYLVKPSRTFPRAAEAPPGAGSGRSPRPRSRRVRRSRSPAP